MAHHEPPHQDLHCLQIQLFSSLVVKELTLKMPITTAADDIHEYFFIVLRENKTDSHEKNQALFSSKGKSKKIFKVSAAAIFFLRFKG